MICPDCSQANPEPARFCLACGRPLVGGNPEAATSTPVPAMRDERRLVTVVFVDVVGSTSIASRLDAEDWKAVINGAFAVLTPPVYRYGGTIPQFLGDGFLALFGAPVAHEDDPHRAVRAALERRAVCA
jgi:class 3 adenylate cyclase